MPYIGPYELLERLGEGGMGAVYRARDLQLNRFVAIKLMHPHIARHSEFRQRFVQEARAIAALDHPHIIKVFAFHADGDETYLVMEYISTGSLRDSIKANGSMTLDDGLMIIRQIASALHYAHEAGMIHRDVKPGNVLLKLNPPDYDGPDFNALLGDFGLVKLSENTTLLTAGSSAMGTLAYMAPEQLRGEEIDHRADLYALGIMLYELAVGELPFKPSNMYQAVQMHSDQPPPPPRNLQPLLSERLEAIILKAIAKSPANRYQSGAEFSSVLRNLELPPLSVEQQDSLITYLSAYAQRGFTLQIQREGASQISIPLAQGDVMVLGGDVPLEGISSNAALLDVSENVTLTALDEQVYVDEVLLLRDVPERLRPTQVVTVGPYAMQIVPEAHAPRRERAQETVIAPADVKMEPRRVMNGETALLTIKNNSHIVQHYDVEMTGMPPDWVSPYAQTVKLMPGEQQSALLSFIVPADGTAGSYPIGIHITDGDGRVTDLQLGELDVRPHYAFDVDIHPVEIRTAGNIQVAVANRGNITDTYIIQPRDRAGALEFDPSSAELVVQDGQFDEVMFAVKPKNRPLLGNSRHYGLEFEVDSAHAVSQRYTAQLIDNPLIPIWLGSIALVGCLLLAGIAGVFALGGLGGDDDTPAAEAVVKLTFTPTSTPTFTPTDTPTATETFTPTDTFTPTHTIDSAATLFAEQTRIALQFEATRTALALLPTTTPTPVPPTATPTQGLSASITSIDENIRITDGRRGIRIHTEVRAWGYKDQELRFLLNFFWDQNSSEIEAEWAPDGFNTTSGYLVYSTRLTSTFDISLWEDLEVEFPYDYFPTNFSVLEIYARPYIEYSLEDDIYEWGDYFAFTLPETAPVRIVIEDYEFEDNGLRVYYRAQTIGLESRRVDFLFYFYWENGSPIITDSRSQAPADYRVADNNQLTYQTFSTATYENSLWEDQSFLIPFTYFPEVESAGEHGAYVRGFIEVDEDYYEATNEMEFSLSY